MSSLNRLIPILTIFNYWFSCLYTVLYPTLSWKTGFLRLIINCQTDWICNGCCICRQKVRRKVVAGCSRNRKAGFLHGTATSGCRRAPSSTATIPVSYLQIHFTIWDKYSLKIETNTLSNLRQILWFPASSELNCCYHSCFIFTNTFYNLRQIHFTIWDKYILQFKRDLRETHFAIYTNTNHWWSSLWRSPSRWLASQQACLRGRHGCSS